MMNKKGDVTDILIFVSFIFFFGLMIFVSAKVFPTIVTSLNQSSLNINQTQTSINTLHNVTTEGFNQGFIILFAGLIIVQIGTAFLIRQHPFFIILYLVTLVAGAFLGMVMSNAFTEISTNPAFVDTLAEQPVISWVMDNLLAVVIGVDILTLIIIFAKPGGSRI